MCYIPAGGTTGGGQILKSWLLSIRIRVECFVERKEVNSQMKRTEQSSAATMVIAAPVAAASVRSFGKVFLEKAHRMSHI